MINRYSRPEMTKVWSQKEKYRIWFEIEAYACEAMEQIGLVPEGTTSDVLKASGIDYDIDEIDSIEKVERKHLRANSYESSTMSGIRLAGFERALPMWFSQ